MSKLTHSKTLWCRISFHHNNGNNDDSDDDSNDNNSNEVSQKGQKEKIRIICRDAAIQMFVMWASNLTWSFRVTPNTLILSVGKRDGNWERYISFSAQDNILTSMRIGIHIIIDKPIDGWICICSEGVLGLYCSGAHCGDGYRQHNWWAIPQYIFT